ncbi:cupin domain-containing protein [Candidatus Poriferisocius sp.]|uniref:cupin domain-containing protein n=1 Tax=Candidatus Poriferisocius sp. TaxID=3101276 RepID=UPI003B01AD2F
MSAVDVVLAAERPSGDAYPGPTVEVVGGCAARLVSPDGASLWLVAADLAAGTELRWATDHGDEAVYVRSGSLTVDGRVCPADGAAVVEAGVAATATAKSDTSIVHVGPADPVPPPDGLRGPAETAGRGVRVVGPDGLWATVDDTQRTRFFSDASSPTNRLWLLATDRPQYFESSAHSHSQDELIHVLRGEIRVGRRVVGAGDTLWVDADRRYKLYSGDEGVHFINYRRDASVMTSPNYDAPLLEAGEATNMTWVNDTR